MNRPPSRPPGSTRSSQSSQSSQSRQSSRRPRTAAPQPYDICYRIDRGSPPPRCRLAVDYDLIRLAEVTAPEKLCGELSAVTRPGERIFMNALPHTPMSQLELDFSAAGRLLRPGGGLRVAVRDPKTVRRIGKLLRAAFAEVQVDRGDGETAYFCRGWRGAPAPANTLALSSTDPRSGRAFTLATRPGLFAYSEVDPGTRLLLDAIGDVAECRTLDLGCGYGIVGLTAAARGARVTLVDSDARAVELARANLAANGLAGEVLLQDGISGLPAASFERVLSNPPTHAGSAKLQELFAGMLRVTVPGGWVALVVRERLNYEKWLCELGEVRRLATAAGYKVLEIRKG
jgi:23S rRNA (guanine1835-N2)-methyltransferase